MEKFCGILFLLFYVLLALGGLTGAFYIAIGAIKQGCRFRCFYDFIFGVAFLIIGVWLLVAATPTVLGELWLALNFPH